MIISTTNWGWTVTFNNTDEINKLIDYLKFLNLWPEPWKGTTEKGIIRNLKLCGEYKYNDMDRKEILAAIRIYKEKIK